ncbi:MAG: succinate--CoA ligase subunit alpha [Vicinamibacterales bacterium]
MAILAGAQSRIVIQGITGYNGRNIAGRMLQGRSPLVGGVTPGRRGAQVLGLPVVDSCYEAVEELGANATFVSVPAPMAREACEEAIEAGLRLLVVYTEGVPIADAIQMAAFARARGAVLLGPNAAGCVSPGLANVSDMNDANLDPGSVGIVSKSGTLACEVVDCLRAVGLGESTVVCLGGDAVTATSHRDILQRFEADPETHCVVLVGEVGGRSELIAAELVALMRTPVVAYIAGRSAPPGRRMGHAGALLGSHEEAAVSKIVAMRQAGAHIVDDITQIGWAVADVYARAAGA